MWRELSAGSGEPPLGARAEATNTARVAASGLISHRSHDLSARVLAVG